LSWDVYLVTDRALSRGRSLLDIVQAAVRGGVSAVQLREKNLATAEFYRAGLEIRDFLRASGTPFIINDRVDIALALEADGVHLGQADMPVEVARRILGTDKIIGLSVERPEHLTHSAVAHADYLGISPVFATSTKPELAFAWGVDGVRQARRLTELPLVAIGAVKKENAYEVIQAGADCVAVVSGIVAAADPELAARELVETVRAAKAAR
jgi:thiamine-phosphate pyrophosphorylase